MLDKKELVERSVNEYVVVELKIEGLSDAV